jgi:hypothetical protein
MLATRGTTAGIHPGQALLANNQAGFSTSLIRFGVMIFTSAKKFASSADYTPLFLRKIRRALTPNGSSINAPAKIVESSGTGVVTCVWIVVGMKI